MGQVLRFQKADTPTVTVPGCPVTLVLSDVGILDVPVESDDSDLDGDGAILIECVHPVPYRFLWVLDSENDLYMWRVTDGDMKVIASASEMFSTVVKLDQLGHLNRLTSGEVATVTHEMSALADAHLSHLQTYIESTKSDLDRLADLAATTVFDRDVRPVLERTLVQGNVVPIGFKVSENLMKHGRSAAEQLRSHLIGQVLGEHLTVEAVDAELTLRGVNLQEVDCQLSYWAVNSLKDEVWSRYSPR